MPAGDGPDGRDGPDRRDGPGELDRHLFNEGSHRRLWQVLGGHLLDGDQRPSGASFVVWAPEATRVRVVGDWCGWDERSAQELTASPSGLWWGTVAAAGEGDRYKYEVTAVDGRVQLRADPCAQAAEEPPGTASVLFRSRYRWASDDGSDVGSEVGSEVGSDWREQRRERNQGRLSVYEVHLGSWRRHPDGRSHSARELAAPLADWVCDMGFTHVELLPVATHPFFGSWGYQVSGYYAPDARLGTPDDLRHLIDVCHDRGLGVLVDWVPAHFPRDEFALARFDGSALYEHADPRRGEHPDWGTLVFNHGRNEVRNFLVANALYWLEEFRVDGLRVDAVASMLYLDYSRSADQWVPNDHGGREDLDAIGFIRALTSAVADDQPGALVVAEESTSWQGVTAPVDWGGLGFDLKWNLGWMHDTLDYFSQDPVHRSHHHGELTFPMVYARHERWILPLSHDEVVHGKGSLLARQPGDDWQRFANLRSLLAWQWCHPGRQLLFMGGELAQAREWSHDRELDWWLLEQTPHRGVHALIGDLNALQSQRRALWAGDDELEGTFGWLDADDQRHSVFSFWRSDPTAPGDRASTVLVVANLTPVPRHGYRVGVPHDGPWQVVLDTDAERYGGSAHELVPDADSGPVADPGTPWQDQPASLLLTLPPLSVVVLAPR